MFKWVLLIQICQIIESTNAYLLLSYYISNGQKTIDMIHDIS